MKRNDAIAVIVALVGATLLALGAYALFNPPSLFSPSSTPFEEALFGIILLLIALVIPGSRPTVEPEA